MFLKMTAKNISRIFKFHKQSYRIISVFLQKPLQYKTMSLKSSLHNMTVIGTGIALVKLPWISRVQCKTEDAIMAPDPSTLTTEVLLRNASFSVVEATTTFLSQVTISLAESYEQYTKALFVLIRLMEYRLKVLDNEKNEQKISDLILEARASVNKFKTRNQELQLLYISAYNLVTEASTAAYSAGSEFHSTVATNVTQSSEIHLSPYRSDLSEAQSRLREMEAKVINIESELADKQRQSNEENIDSLQTDIKDSDLENKIQQLDLSNLDESDEKVN